MRREQWRGEEGRGSRRIELSGPGNIFLSFLLRALFDFFFHQEVGASKAVTK